MPKEWVTGLPEEAAGACHLVQALSAQRPPDQRLRVKALSAHLLPGLLHQIHLPGLLTEDIPEPMIAVTTERQVPSKEMLLQDKGHLTDQVVLMLQGQTLPMKEIELRILKTIAETEQILITAEEI